MRSRPSRTLLAMVLALSCAPALAGEAPASPLAGITVRRDVAYARGAKGPLTLDVYRPGDARGPSPVLLFFHGGGWVMGSKREALPEVYPGPAYGDRTWPSMLPYLRRGLAVVAGDYRLAAEAPAPAAVDDCRLALDWVSQHGADYGLDPQRVVTIGASAGGHLALMVAFTDAGRVRGAIDLYGITDVPPLLAPPTPRPWALEWIGTGPDAAARARSVSPLALVHPGLPPVLIAHSDADDVVPYDQAERLVRALGAAGVEVELLTFPGGLHGFLTPAERSRLEASILAFLQRLGLAGEQSASRRSQTQEKRGEQQEPR